MEVSCTKCERIQQTLLRHEQTITQLLAIIAATNSKVAELAMNESQPEKTLPVSPR